MINKSRRLRFLDTKITKSRLEVEKKARVSTTQHIEFGRHHHGTRIRRSERSRPGFHNETERIPRIVGPVSEFQRGTGIEERGETQSEFLRLSSNDSRLKRQTQNIDRNFGSEQRLLIFSKLKRSLHL